MSDVSHTSQQKKHAASKPASIARSVTRGLKISEDTLLLILAVVVGLLTALAAYIFRMLVDKGNSLFFHPGNIVPGIPNYLIIPLLPALGGLMVGILVYRIMKIRGGHGVPAVMRAVATGKVRIPSNMAVKSSTSVITMSTGGSAGPEGPLVEIGAVIGVHVGRISKVSRQRLGNLIGCGAASGIAAIFNAPIGGVFFALELILRELRLQTFTPVVLSAVVAAVFSQVLTGTNEPAFQVPQELFKDSSGVLATIPAYAVLGIVCGLVGALFISTVYFTQERFQKIRIPLWAKPAAGGLAVGIIGAFLPEILGEGYDVVTRALDGEFLFGLLILFCLAKIVATSLTLGSGGTGGFFAPAMFMGAAVGGAVGLVTHEAMVHLVPHQVVTLTSKEMAAAFALVGMAGVVAGALNAPFAAILIIFEVTGGGYQLILPLMIVVSLSVLVTHRLKKGSVYTLSLLKDGFDLDEAKKHDPLERVGVGEVMKKRFTTLKGTMTLSELLSIAAHSNDAAFPVVDDKGALKGVISIYDLRSVLHLREMGQVLIASDIADPNPPRLVPDNSVSDALSIFSRTDMETIPVVDPENKDTLIGMIRRQDVFSAYKKVAKNK